MKLEGTFDIHVHTGSRVTARQCVLGTSRYLVCLPVSGTVDNTRLIRPGFLSLTVTYFTRRYPVHRRSSRVFNGCFVGPRAFRFCLFGFDSDSIVLNVDSEDERDIRILGILHGMIACA